MAAAGCGNNVQTPHPAQCVQGHRQMRDGHSCLAMLCSCAPRHCPSARRLALLVKPQMGLSVIILPWPDSWVWFSTALRTWRRAPELGCILRDVLSSVLGVIASPLRLQHVDRHPITPSSTMLCSESAVQCGAAASAGCLSSSGWKLHVILVPCQYDIALCS